jgi:C1A family cysteine protease
VTEFLGRYGKGHIPDPPGRIASGAHVLFGAVPDSTPSKGGLTTGPGAITPEPVKDQESTSECVAFAGAGVITETMKAQGTPLPEAVSEHSIYIPARCLDRDDINQPLTDDGSMPSQAWRSIADFGVTGESKWPWSPKTVNDEPRLDKVERMSALKFRGALKLYERGDAFVQRIRQSLAAKVGIFFCVNVTRAFEDYQGGVMTAKHLQGEKLGGHAMHALDYETLQINGLTVVRIKNSWNKTWGESGYGLVDESFIIAGWTDTYVARVSLRGGV